MNVEAHTERERSSMLVHEGDTDGLIRHVGFLVEDEDWDAVLELAVRCQRAHEVGRQLFGVSAYCWYRLALDAPGGWAGEALGEDVGRFTLGPLPEVAASTHEWDELDQHLPQGPSAVMAAHECVIRGDDLRHDPVAAELHAVYDMPLVLLEWEPQWPVATYHDDRAEFPSPDPIRLEPAEGKRLSPLQDRESEEATAALLDLVAPWVQSSNGLVNAVAVAGTALDAIATLSPAHLLAAKVTPQQALARMGWAGASGGALGVRRGAAAGRSLAWWALAQLAGIEPLEGGHGPATEAWGLELGQAACELQWWVWNDGAAPTGWGLHVAVEDPVDRIAWAIGAADRKTEDDS